MPQNTFANSVFKLKGGMYTLTVLQLIKPDPEAFKQQLEETLKQAPNFFLNAPVIIDLSQLEKPQVQIDFNQLNNLLKDKHLFPVGIIGGTEQQQEMALAADLALFPQSKFKTDSAEKSKPTSQKSTQASATKQEPTTKLIRQPVRSGQQIYAKGGDLVILSSVSPGAEVLADGNIHIYGALRGRALAGVQGDQQARIFCQTLDAQLVSIAGLYQLSNPQDGLENVQIFIEDERLQVAPL